MDKENFIGIMGIGMWENFRRVINRVRVFIIIIVEVGMRGFLIRIS
jgi:hypothetical protein